MKTLQDATERICELKGNVLALDALVTALMPQLSAAQQQQLRTTFATHAEVARTILLNAPISEHTIAAFERDVHRMTALIAVD